MPDDVFLWKCGECGAPSTRTRRRCARCGDRSGPVRYEADE